MPRLNDIIKVHKRVGFLTVFLFALTTTMQGQYFSLGQEPSSVKWKAIKSDHFKLIYPAGLSNKAPYLVNALEYARMPVIRSLYVTPGRFPVILHSHTNSSNAYAAYAPGRIELLTTTPQDSYAQPWLDQLVIHEYRHAGHYRKMEQGFSKFLYYVFGQQASAAVLGAFVPFWFIEGDATVIETALSETGRGRSPSFEMELRAQYLEKGPYHYDKATHGSFRDFVPDRYVLGYHLIGMARVKYGKDAWDLALNRVAKYPFMLVPFSSGLKKSTGFGKVSLYKNLNESLVNQWRLQDEKIIRTEAVQISPVTEEYTDYLNPVPLNDTTVAAIRISMDDIPRIVTINTSTGLETIVSTQGTRPFYDVLAGADSRLLWGERIPDIRWQMRDYSVILEADLYDERTSILTSKTRYFAPDISSDGEKIVTVELANGDTSNLVILDHDTRDEILKVKGNDQETFIMPRWSDDGYRVVTIVLDQRGERIDMIDTRSGERSTILPPSPINISHPSFHKDFILYTGSYSGIDNIYALDLRDSQIYRVTSSRFGAGYARESADGRQIYYADYSSGGHRIMSTVSDPEKWERLSEIENHSIGLADQLATQEGFIFNRDSIPEVSHDSRKYRKGLNLFNLHSWAPVSLDVSNVEDIQVKPGFSLFSQNLLSSSFASFRFEHDLNEETNRVFFDYTYAGQFPVFNFGIDHGGRKRNYTHSNDTTYLLSWLETNMSAGVSVPLNFSRRMFFNTVQPSVQLDHTILNMDEGVPFQFRIDRITSLRYRIFASRQAKRSLRDLYPRWGQAVDISYRHGVSLNGAIIGVEGYLFFPGILRHHGLRIYGGWQERSGEYNFSGFISTPRGYSLLNTERMVSLKADYVFPIFYPDWRLGPVLYIKRFKSRLFFDHAFDTRDPANVFYNSFGADLTSDLHVFSFISPFDVGLRVIHIPEFADTQFQLLFSIDIGSLY